MSELDAPRHGPLMHRNPDGTATLQWPLGWPDTTVVHRSVLQEWESTHNQLVAERKLADRLFTALDAHYGLGNPMTDTTLLSIVDEYRQARRG